MEERVQGVLEEGLGTEDIGVKQREDREVFEGEAEAVGEEEEEEERKVLEVVMEVKQEEVLGETEVEQMDIDEEEEGGVLKEVVKIRKQEEEEEEVKLIYLGQEERKKEVLKGAEAEEKVEGADEGVDELEELIKEVFLKGLIPDEGQAESWHQLYEKQSRQQGETEEEPEKPRAVMKWSRQEVVEKSVQEKVLVRERLEKEEEDLNMQQPPTVDEDDWFILLQRPPYQLAYAPLVSWALRAQGVSIETVSAAVAGTRVTRRREALVRETEPQAGKKWRPPGIAPPPQPGKAREDDWLALLDVVPRETPYRPPATLVGRVTEGTLSAVVQETISERRGERKEVAFEEAKIQPEGERPPPLPVREREDDWFVLLDVVPRELAILPQVSLEKPVQVIRSVVTETRTVVVIKETKIQPADEATGTLFIVKQRLLPQPMRGRDDDWFVLLDAVPREPIVLPDVVEVKVKTSEEEQPGLVVVEKIRLQQREKPREVRWSPSGRDDDWFELFDVVYRASVSPVFPERRVEVYQDVHGSLVKVVERSTDEMAVIVEERVQTETVPIRRRPPLAEREEGDDWFVLFEAVHVKPTAVPPAAPVIVPAVMAPVEQKPVVEVQVMEETIRLEKRGVVLLPTPREVDDNWFVLWDRVPVERSTTLPALLVASKDVEQRTVVTETGYSIIRQESAMAVEQRRRPVSVMAAQRPPPVERKEGDDWFVLFEALREEPAKMPTVGEARLRPSPRAEISTIERRTQTAVSLEEERRQKTVILEEERRPPQILTQRLPPPQRAGVDDWVTLLDVAPKKSVPLLERIQVSTIEPRLQIIEKRPLFEKRILQERPRAQREVEDDWFVLLDVESVIGPRKGARPVSAPVFSQAALAEAGVPMAPQEHPQTSTPVSRAPRHEGRKLEVTVEAVEPAKPEAGVKKRARRTEGDSIYVRHSLLMLEDYDKPQEEVLRHHASISELKRNFMASAPEPRPSEWDKRLSTHSPFRSVVINGQPQAGADGATVDVTGGDKDEDAPLTGVQTVSSEAASGTTVTTTTTHISKVVKSGSSETRVEKRIVITAESETDKEQGSDGPASAM